MASTAAVLNILVRANTSTATANLRKTDTQLRRTARAADTAAKHTDRHSKALHTVGRSAAYALGAGGFGGGLYAVFDVVKRSISQFKESERVTRQTAAAIRSTGGAAHVTAAHVKSLSTALSEKTGVDDEAIQTSQNLLLTFTHVRNEAGKGNKIFDQSTVAILDMATAMNHGATPSTSDLHSATLQLGKALQDPVKGMTALRRVGVMLDAGQQKQIKTLVKHGHSLEAQKIILRELTREFGGSAAKQATPMKRLSVTLNNLAETIGRALNPAIQKGAAWLEKFVNGMMHGTGQGGRFVKTLKGIYEAVKPTAVVIGRMAVGIAKFAGAHPDLAKVAVQLGAVWLVMKKMRGFSLANVLGGMGGAGAGKKVGGGFFSGFAGAARTAGRVVIGAALINGISQAMSGNKTFGERLQAGVSGATFGLFPAPRDIDKRMQTIVARIQGWRKSGRLALNRPGDPSNSIIRKGDLGDFDRGQLHMIRGMARLRNIANRTIGPGAKLKTGAWLNPGPVIADLTKVDKGFGELRHNTAVSMSRINQVVDSNARAIRHSLGTHSQAGERAFAKNMRLAAGAASDSLKHGWLSADQFLKSIRHSFVVNSRGSARTAKVNFNHAEAAIRDAVNSGRVSADSGLREINRLFRIYLGKFGLKGAAATFYLKSGSRGTGTVPGSQGTPLGGHHAQRGMFVSEGRASGDSVPALLEKGEGVINRRAVEALGGPEAIHAINQSVPRFQTGGVVPRQVMGGPNAAPRVMDQRGLDRTRHRANAILAEARRRAQASAVGGEILGKGSLRMYAFPLPQFGSEGRVDRGQDMEASRPHATTVAVGHGKVVNAGIGFPGIQIRLSRGPLKGNTAFYGHNNAVFTKVGANVRPGQPVGQTGNPIGGGGPTHTEIGFMQGYGSQSGHWVGPGSAGGMLMHNLLHRIAPGRIGAPARMARGGIAGLEHAKRHRFTLPELRALWVAAGGNYHKATTMGHVAIAESGLGTGHGLPWAHNPSGATGLWQILGGAGDLYDPWVNATNAVAKYRGGGLSPWAASRSNWGRWANSYDRRKPALLRGPGGRRGSSRQTRLPPALPVKGLAGRLKGIRGIGLSKAMETRLKVLAAVAAKFEEWANRAEALGGKVFGHDQAYWLQDELKQLFPLRNYLIKAHNRLLELRKRIQRVLLPRARKHLKELRKHPVLNRDRIKAYTGKIIPALRSQYGKLGSRDGDILSALSDVQGAGSSMRVMRNLPPVGELGGSIFDTQAKLKELGTKADVTDGGAAVPSERLQSIIDLLREQLQQANLGKAVSEGAFQVFRDMPSFQTLPGQWHTVPGPSHQGVPAVVHGGEMVGRPGDTTVQVYVHPGGSGADVRVNGEWVRAEVRKVLRSEVSRVGRTPARAGT